jgi:hypothetical protein
MIAFPEMLLAHFLLLPLCPHLDLILVNDCGTRNLSTLALARGIVIEIAGRISSDFKLIMSGRWVS